MSGAAASPSDALQRPQTAATCRAASTRFFAPQEGQLIIWGLPVIDIVLYSQPDAVRLVLNRNQFDDKNKRRVGRDRAVSFRAVTKRRWNYKYRLIANMQFSDTLVPAFDNPARSEFEGIWSAAIA